MNLNDLLIPDADGDHQPLADPRRTSVDGLTQVFFRHLETELLQLINDADVVIGCVAWLTNQRIIAALAKKRAVAIVIQKEDFLRPDLEANENWGLEIRSRYDQLKNRLDRLDLPGILCIMSMHGDRSIDPIRCLGNYNFDKRPASPRAHHKFLVFARLVDWPEWKKDVLASGTNADVKPYAAWTGSFNLTANATNSFENAIVTRDPQLVDAFVEEWSQMEALSEPLDWSSVWVAPEWRIGT